MIKNRSIKKYIKLDNPVDEYNELQLDVYYFKGGYNYFDYKPYPRSYRLSVKPVNVVTFPDGTKTLSYTMLGKNSGGFKTIAETTRYSEKKLKELAETYLNVDNELTSEMINTIKLESSKS